MTDNAKRILGAGALVLAHNFIVVPFYASGVNNTPVSGYGLVFSEKVFDCRPTTDDGWEQFIEYGSGEQYIQKGSIDTKRMFLQVIPIIVITIAAMLFESTRKKK
jgi:hypothetical protein